MRAPQTDLAKKVKSISDSRIFDIRSDELPTWCPGCNEEAGVLEEEIWQVYREQGVTVIAIDIQESVGLVLG